MLLCHEFFVGVVPGRMVAASFFSLPVQSNSAIAEFDMSSAEIGQARFRMKGRGGAFFTAEQCPCRPTRPRFARPPSPKTGRENRPHLGADIATSMRSKRARKDF